MCPLIQGEVVIGVPVESQVRRQVVRKRPEVSDIDVDLVVRLFYVDVPPPSLVDAGGDERRLIRSLDGQWSLSDLRLEPRLFLGLQRSLIAGKSAEFARR